MATIQSIRLRIWVPGLFFIGFLLLLLMVLLIEYWNASEDLKNQLIEQSQEISTGLALPIRRSLEQARENDIPALLSNFRVNRGVEAVVLTDEAGRVLFSDHFAWRGKPLLEVLSESQWLDAGVGTSLYYQELPNGAISRLPIKYQQANSVGSEASRVYLWIKQDSAIRKHLLIHHVWKNIGLLASAALLAFLFVAWMARRFIRLPARALVDYARDLSEGHYDAFLDVRGRGEWRQLASAHKQLARKTQESISQLKDREERLSITLDAIGDAVLVADAAGKVTRLNPRAEELTGWSEYEALGRPVEAIFKVVKAGTEEAVEHPVAKVLRERCVVGLANDTTLIGRKGWQYKITDSAAPILDNDGRLIGVIMVFQDVTARYDAQRELAAAHSQLQAITLAIPDPCFVFGADGTYLEIFGGPEDLLYEARDRLLGNNLCDVIPSETADQLMQAIRETLASEKSQSLDYELNVQSGVRHFEATTAVVNHGDSMAVLWIARDITRRWEAERDVARLAKYDALTGLPNRRMLETYLQQVLARAERSRHYAALLFLDLDNFKMINDSLGHVQGDRVLVRVAERLESMIRSGDLAARFGGDEFVIILEDLGNDLVTASQYAEKIANKFLGMCKDSMVVGGERTHLEMSIGIVMFPDDATPWDLIKRADIAMYRAKETGRGRACFFSADLQTAVEERLAIQRDLREAIAEDQLRLYVQPSTNVLGNWVGGEVLVRWEHPKRGLLTPDAFIPIAEDTGLITALDGWVISHAIEAMGNLSKKGALGAAQGLSLNVSGPMMMEDDFVETITLWLTQSDIDPKLITLEITERLLLEDYPQATRVMDQLRGLGVHFAIDDFGTGCSSLRYLQQLPLDVLKIDRSFVRRLPDHSGDQTLVDSIILLADQLGLKVVAEGVETPEQHRFLGDRGVHYFQGYHFSKPIPWAGFWKAMNTASVSKSEA